MLKKPLDKKEDISFSVVIPLYNKVSHIKNTINSVLKQNHLANEIIVVDDGSNDGSAELVEKTFGNRVFLIRQNNQGVSAARNRGISLACSEYIALLDADDMWSVHFLAELAQLAKVNPQADLLATAYQYIDQDDRYSQPKIRVSKRAQNYIDKYRLIRDYFEIAASGDLPFCASSVAIRKSFTECHGLFPEGESMGEDQWVWSNAAIYSNISYSPRALTFYNRSAENRACTKRPPQSECKFSRRLTNLSSVAMTEFAYTDSIAKYTSAHLLDLAKRNVSHNQFHVAWKLIRDPRNKYKPILTLKVFTLLLFKVAIYNLKKRVYLKPPLLFRFF